MEDLFHNEVKIGDIVINATTCGSHPHIRKGVVKKFIGNRVLINNIVPAYATLWSSEKGLYPNPKRYITSWKYAAEHEFIIMGNVNDNRSLHLFSPLEWAYIVYDSGISKLMK